MKKFFRTLKWFFLPALLLTVLLFCIPVPDSYKYHYIHDDCFDRRSFIYQRIFENNEPIDIAFLGTSHTINAVNDSLVQSLLADSSAHVANLGFCWLGNDLQYMIMKDIFSRKHPHLLILEVREEENAFSHIMFPYLADGSDLVRPVTITNKYYFRNLFCGAEERLAFLRSALFQKDSVSIDKPDLYGYEARGDVPATKIFSEQKIIQQNDYENLNSGFGEKMNTIYPNAYVKKMAALAKENNCRIAFLFLPSYGAVTNKPFYPDIYEQCGKILSPPTALLNDTLNWSNTGHLNEKGATELSEWLAAQIDSL